MDKYLRNTEFKTYYLIKSGIFKPTQYVKSHDDISFTIKKANIWFSRRIRMW